MTVPSATERSIHSSPTAIPEAPSGRSTGWWGMVLFISTEGATFAAFLASYFYLRFSHETPWPPPGEKLPGLVYPSIATAVLVVSCLPMLLADRVTPRGRRGASGLGVAGAFLGGCAFLVLQGLDWAAEYPASTPSKDAYGSLFYVVTGLHALHVLVGVGMLLFLLAGVGVGRLNSDYHEPVHLVALYWYFMSVVALGVYATVYLSPYL
jgi:cytochrome c oxidase subunit 3